MTDPNHVDRFWSKVSQPDSLDACWLWTGGVDRDGYGRFYFEGGTAAAHRVAYGLATDSDPGDLHVLHRCDNPPCCNPRHLWLGTNAENRADMIAKGRGVYPSGASNGRAKLTKHEVIAIRRLRSVGITQRAIAAEFNISVATVGDIDRRRTWTDI